MIETRSTTHSTYRALNELEAILEEHPKYRSRTAGGPGFDPFKTCSVAELPHLD